MMMQHHRRTLLLHGMRATKSRQTLSIVSASQQKQQQQSQQSSNKTQVRHYRPLPERPADPLPWKTYTTRTENLHTVVYNPLGKSMRPPMPILMLPGLTQTHQAFSDIVKHMNYPYGVVSMDMRGRGKSNNETAMKGMMSSEDMQHYHCGDLFQHVKDVIHVLNEYHVYRAVMVGSDVGAMVAYWVAKLYPDRCNGIVMLNSGFAADQFNVAEKDLHAEIERTTKNQQAADANAHFQAVTGITSTTLDQLSLNAQTRFKYEHANPSDSALLERDLNATKKHVEHLNKMVKIRHPILAVRSEHGLTEKSPSWWNAQATSEFDKVMNVKDVYFAKGATHHSMLWDDAHSKIIAQKIDEFVGRYDTHRRIEKDFEEIKNFEE